MTAAGMRRLDAKKMAQLYTQEQRGVEIVRIEDKVQFATARRYADAVPGGAKAAV